MLGQALTGGRPRRRGRLPRALAGSGLLALALGLGACAQPDGGGVASLGQGQQAPETTTAQGGGGKDFHEARLEWAECMREHGVDVPDPSPGGQVTARAGRRAFVDDPDFEQAQKACESKMQGVEPPAGLDPEHVQERVLALTKCLREAGFDVPDPQFGSGGRALVRIAPEGVDVESEAFQDAMRTCQKKSGMDQLGRDRAGGRP